MNNFQDCYTYENIRSISDKLDMNLSDKETRILQHRLFDFNKLMNILFVEIYENDILKKEEPFLSNLKTKINNISKIELSNSQITSLIQEILKNKNKCKKVLDSQSEQLGGSFGWILPSKDKQGKSIDIFSLILDFIGLVPGMTGNMADLTNIITNIYRKRYFDAGISFLGFFSYIGLLAPFAKLGMRYYNKEDEEVSDDEGEGEEFMEE